MVIGLGPRHRGGLLAFPSGHIAWMSGLAALRHRQPQRLRQVSGRFVVPELLCRRYSNPSELHGRLLALVPGDGLTRGPA